MSLTLNSAISNNTFSVLMSLFLSKPAILNKDKEQLKLALMGEHCLALG